MNNDIIYRGTDLEVAQASVFQTGYRQGDTYDLFRGFMSRDELQKDHSESLVSELPTEPEGEDLLHETVDVTGGFTERLGVADSFAKGPLPIVFHLRRSDLPRLVRVRYDYDWFDSTEGGLPWVYSGTGELRINEQLQGLTSSSTGERHAITYWGDGLRSRILTHEAENELIAPNTARVDIESAVEAVTVYVTRPLAKLAGLDGYTHGHRNSKLESDDAVSVSKWSEEKAVRRLYEELREVVDWNVPVFAVHLNRILAQEVWEIDPNWVEYIHGPSGEMQPSSVPPTVMGR